MTLSTISVITPVFNRERYLAQAIESVLHQTRPPDEVIVVDDGSTDGSAAVVQRFPNVRYHYQSNSGPAIARNQGVQLAQGEFLAFLDSDDLWLPEKLSQQLAAFESNPHLDMVFGQVQQFYSDELDEVERQKIRIPKEVLPGYHVGTMLIRREAFLKVGWFETHFKYAEFVSWYVRATDLGLQSTMLPEIVMRRRLHQTNLGRTENLDRREYLAVVKASLNRRRASEHQAVEEAQQ